MAAFCFGELARWLTCNLHPDGCDNTFRMVETFCRMHGLDAEAVKYRVSDRAHCDCELIMNVFLADDAGEFLPASDIIPPLEFQGAQ